MKRLLLIFLFLIFIVNFSFAEIKINCYSDFGKFIGHTYLDTRTDVAYVYNPSGYYIGYIELKNEDFLYYSPKGVLKARVHINTSISKAIFYFWL